MSTSIIRLLGEEYDLKSACGKATASITITNDQISDVVVENIGAEYTRPSGQLPVAVPHEGKYIIITKYEPCESIQARLLTKYNLKKAKLVDAELVEQAEREHARRSIPRKNFNRAR